MRAGGYGAAQAGDPQVRPSRPIPVADLLIEPTRFPAQYAAAVVPPKDVDRVMGEIDGVAAGSEVTPPECAPLPVLTDQQAAVQGTDDKSGARLTVTVVRPVPSVRAGWPSSPNARRSPARRPGTSVTCRR